jgi:hypothetical protein
MDIKTCIDWAAVGTIAATFVGWLPSIAAGLAIIWSLMRMYDWVQEKRKK